MNTIKSSNNFFAEYSNRIFAELFKKAIIDLDLYSRLSEKEQDIYARFFAYGLTGVIVETYFFITKYSPFIFFYSTVYIRK